MKNNKKIQHFLCVACIALFAAVAIVSCKRDDDFVVGTNDHPSSPEVLGQSRTVDVAGQVVDESGHPISGAIVTAGYGNQSTTTDDRGFFMLKGIAGFENLALVKVQKEGYFNGSRSFIPTAKVNRVRIAMLRKNDAGAFLSTSGGTLGLENLSITFLPNSVGLNGAPYDGMVHVSINYIDPSQLNAMFEQMPGNMYGLHNNELNVLKSYGMAGVELRDANGNELQLLPGTSATVRFTVPSDLVSTAPGTIPLWHYSEEQGYWIEEGAASLEGNTYVGQVAHFSFWNCDDFDGAVEFTCHVFDNMHPGPGTPLSGVTVELISAQYGSTNGITDNDGTVSGLVPQGEEMVMNIYMSCGGNDMLMYSQVVGPFMSDSEMTINVDEFTNPVTVVHGQLLNAEGQPVDGVVFFDDWAFTLTTDGYYHMLTCISEVEITGWFYNSDAACYSNPIVVGLTGGYLEQNIMCTGCAVNFSPGAGTSDEEGNFYPTVIIGNQEWIAENLRSTVYANGDPIDQLSDNMSWASATGGAWCTYANTPASAEVYGNLYNWLAVADPRNVCPSGFHVPTDSDWNQVRTFLGGLVGSDELVGGTMKSIGTLEGGDGYWQSPNLGANNFSQFEAHPGGLRFSSGPYYYQGQNGYWWSATTLGPNSARLIRMSYDSTSVYQTTAPEENGLSVRCMRDL